MLACILSGALTTVTLKAMFETRIVLIDGSDGRFNRSYFANLLNFLAIAMLVLIQSVFKYSSNMISSPRRSERINGGQTEVEVFGSYDLLRYVFGPCNFSLSAFHVVVTFFTQTALLFVPATVHAALRQGNIPMIVAIRVYIFKKDFAQHKCIGVGLLIFGVVLMAVSSHTSEDDSSSAMHYGAGILLLCGAAVLLAGRYVAEEVLMQHESIPPLVVVGAQGFIGSLISAAMLIFAHYSGHENFWNTVELLRSSSLVQLLVAEFVAWTILYNFTMAYVTKLFDATGKAMVRGTKPITVWAMQLFCFYVIRSRIPTQQYGEPWLPPRSWYILLAALVVSSGICLYSYSERKVSKETDEESPEEKRCLQRQTSPPESEGRDEKVELVQNTTSRTEGLVEGGAR